MLRKHRYPKSHLINSTKSTIFETLRSPISPKIWEQHNMYFFEDLPTAPSMRLQFVVRFLLKRLVFFGKSSFRVNVILNGAENDDHNHAIECYISNNTRNRKYNNHISHYGQKRCFLVTLQDCIRAFRTI